MKPLEYHDVPAYIQNLMQREGSKALEERTGVPRQALYKIVRDGTAPSMKTLQKLGVRLMVSEPTKYTRWAELKANLAKRKAEAAAE